MAIATGCLRDIGLMCRATATCAVSPDGTARDGVTISILNLWMSSQAAFLAKILVSRAEETALTGNAPVSGGKCGELSETSSRERFCWKTLQLSLLPGAEEMRLQHRLPRWGMTCHGGLYQQPIPEHRISGNDGGVSDFWPTPRATTGTQIRSTNAEGGPQLMDVVRQNRWSTPQVWATPTVQDGKNNAGSSQFQRNSLPLNTQVVIAQSKTGQLNPEWVETLMGYPIGWTDTE